MIHHDFNFQGHALSARNTGCLWWSDHSLLCVSDMHLGKSERIARRGGALLPPFETEDTLARLADEIALLNPKIVVCLGDSFDDLATLDSLSEPNHRYLTSLMAGRHWIWIEGNHDAGPVEIGGSHMQVFTNERITFRHIAETGKTAEISGHYHPKARLAARSHGISRPCFLIDDTRIIMPAFGTYTGGLRTDQKDLRSLMNADAHAVLTGPKTLVMPMRSSAG